MQTTDKNGTNPTGGPGDILTALILDAVSRSVGLALERSGSFAAPTPPDPDKLLSLDEAADLIGVSRPQIDRLARLFGLPYMRVGAVKRIHRGDLLSWARSNATEAA